MTIYHTYDMGYKLKYDDIKDDEKKNKDNDGNEELFLDVSIKCGIDLLCLYLFKNKINKKGNIIIKILV